MSRGQRVRARTETRSTPEASLDAEVTESPLYGVALLKIAMELKRRNDDALEEILSGVLARMSIPEAEFRRFLTVNGGLLRAIAERRRY